MILQLHSTSKLRWILWMRPSEKLIPDNTKQSWALPCISRSPRDQIYRLQWQHLVVIIRNLSQAIWLQQREFYEISKPRDYRLHYDTHDHDRNRAGYTDSEWANDSAYRKPQGGHIFISNGTISCQSRKQDTVAMSTLEAEYIACSEASREQMAIAIMQRYRTQEQKQATTYSLR